MTDHDGTPHGADGAGEGADRPPAEDELGAAVDEALAAEVKRQRARFIQAIMDADRAEGVGRSEHYRNDSVYRDLDPDGPDDPDA